jgi:hypothetical protein
MIQPFDRSLFHVGQGLAHLAFKSVWTMAAISSTYPSAMTRSGFFRQKAPTAKGSFKKLCMRSAQALLFVLGQECGWRISRLVQERGDQDKQATPLTGSCDALWISCHDALQSIPCDGRSDFVSPWTSWPRPGRRFGI